MTRRNYVCVDPPHTVQITDRLIGLNGAFHADLNARINSPASQAVYRNRGGVLPRPDPAVNAEDIEPGYEHVGGNWSIRSAIGSHMEPYLTLVVYRVDYDGLSIVFATDTKPCKPPIALAKGADILVVTCWDHQDVVDRDDVTKAMSGTINVARMAHDTGVEKLVLTHFCSGFTTPNSLDRASREIAEIYSGEVIFGEELMALDV